MAQFDLIGIVVRDMAASLRFYRLLGLDIPTNAETEAHVKIRLSGGVRIAWDSLAMMQGIYPDWTAPAGHRITLAFKCEHPAAVDELHATIVQHGYDSHTPPWDAFWGQRYAVVLDPDENLIDLFAGQQA